jgi:hypothetical protein
MGFVGNWTEFWEFSACDFGVEVAKFGGTAYVKADAMVSAFPPVLSPRRVTFVTKFFCTDTEPQHGPLMFGS